MKINWKVRVKNPWFWVQIAIAALVAMLAYAGLTGADITTWSKLGKLIIDIGNLFKSRINRYSLVIILTH